MPSRTPPRELCSVGARRVGEPLYATASRVDLWLVLEVPGAWDDEVGDSLDPESPVGRALLPVAKAVPRTRILFIKGASRKRRKPITFYLAVSDEAEPHLYRFELESYEALAELDLFAVLAEDERYDAHLDPRPLYLICTHGTHDRCCAKFGFPTYRHLAAKEPECVWQSSHVGGDRFAANLVCLPEGLYYGQTDPEAADAILQANGQGRLHLPNWRGRTCYGPSVQAAEYFLREAQGETALYAYRLWSQRRQGDVTEATFISPDFTRLHSVRVGPAQFEGLRFLTCGTCEEKPVTGYRLLEHQEAPFQPDLRRVRDVEYHLRPAAMRDYAFIYCLRRTTLEHYLDEVSLPLAERSPFFARFDVMRHRVITRDGIPIGAISVLDREEGLHLANLHLLPAHQNRGLGTALIREIQEQARTQGRRLTTQVLKVNPAVAYYERLGFRINGDLGLRHRMLWEG